MKTHLLVFFLAFSSISFAQPWLATRYAQNCAACHAPGRLNLKPSERRCTLSCQGCHTNPNGGGMRNRYGVWTQERWMRSFYFDFLRTNKKAPAPYSEQRYAVREATPESKKKRGKEKGEAERDTNSSPEPHVPSLVTSDATLPIQLTGGSLIYDKREDSWTKTAETREEWMARIPYEDPYREERRMPVTATGDFRYFILSRLANNLGSPGKVQNSLMSVDLGVRVRPFSDYFQVVVEPDRKSVV